MVVAAADELAADEKESLLVTLAILHHSAFSNIYWSEWPLDNIGQ